MYDIFSRDATNLLSTGEEDHSGNGVRRMIMRVVNALGAKMEIGAPMACLHLLENPDHYTSHDFVCFYWRNFVLFVRKAWEVLLSSVDPAYNGTLPGLNLPLLEGITSAGFTHKENNDMMPEDDDTLIDNVTMASSDSVFVSKSSPDDYRFRPAEHESVSLYEWVQCAERYKVSSARNSRQHLHFFKYLPDHPMARTHVVACDARKRDRIVPNFIGGSLPRKDSGDREDYCLTMMTLFVPWRTGIDLKVANETWEDAFNKHTFSAHEKQLMMNFNLRYECYDARDDFYATRQALGNKDIEQLDMCHENTFDDEENCDYVDVPDDECTDDNSTLGYANRRMMLAISQTKKELITAGWSQDFHGTIKERVNSQSLNSQLVLDKQIGSAAWRAIVKSEKKRLWKEKFALLDGMDNDELGCSESELWSTCNDVRIVTGPQWLSKSFQPGSGNNVKLLNGVVGTFGLNEDQERAFRIVANHACCIAPDQLLMHLGGMAGTGKSSVIRALTHFFKERNEPYRFVLLGPTGTSAALIGGSTYHSFLGINTGSRANRPSVAAIADLRE
ncbi:hypothetical protein BJ165DRAFT_1313951, partial [Panaeolus papilionaceus]